MSGYLAYSSSLRRRVGGCSRSETPCPRLIRLRSGITVPTARTHRWKRRDPERKCGEPRRPRRGSFASGLRGESSGRYLVFRPIATTTSAARNIAAATPSSSHDRAKRAKMNSTRSAQMPASRRRLLVGVSSIVGIAASGRSRAPQEELWERRPIPPDGVPKSGWRSTARRSAAGRYGPC
jgi:hypothetical protein